MSLKPGLNLSEISVINIDCVYIRARQSNLGCSFSPSNVASGTPYFSPWWDNLAKDFITLENEAPINNVPIIRQISPLRVQIWCI